MHLPPQPGPPDQGQGGVVAGVVLAPGHTELVQLRGSCAPHRAPPPGPGASGVAGVGVPTVQRHQEGVEVDEAPGDHAHGAGQGRPEEGVVEGAHVQSDGHDGPLPGHRAARDEPLRELVVDDVGARGGVHLRPLQLVDLRGARIPGHDRPGDEGRGRLHGRAIPDGQARLNELPALGELGAGLLSVEPDDQKARAECRFHARHGARTPRRGSAHRDRDRPDRGPTAAPQGASPAGRNPREATVHDQGRKASSAAPASTPLLRVLRAHATPGEPSPWAAAAGALATERAAIEVMLAANPTLAVYGFSTMLGHLDDHSGQGLAQQDLLDAHLVGPLSVLDAEMVHLVTLCKIEQLHHGGAGVHPATFQDLLHAAVAPVAPAVGAWDSSYGSGDVVPASWWVTHLLAGPLTELRRGDTIALINGNFYAAAWAVAAGLDVVNIAARAIAAATRMCALPLSSPLREGLGHPLVSVFDDARRAGRALPWTGPGQPPVSLRDATPYVQAVLAAVGGHGEALNVTLGRTSANPRFTRAGGELVAESQSSFLDQRVTFTLTTLSQLLTLTAGLTQRLLEHRTADLERQAPGPTPALVQPPKVASALLEQVAAQGAGTLRFTGADSEGIEDVRDGALLASMGVLRQSERCRAALDLLETHLAPDADSVARAQAALLDVFAGSPGVPVDILRTFANR